MSAEILDRVYEVVRSRQAEQRPDSWVATLTAKGLPKVRSKVLEEVGELLEASVRLEGEGDPAPTVHEAADVLFHLLVLLGAQDVPAQAVWDELERRFGTGGLVEKAARSRNKDT